jgi:glycosyltransferase involved in cell wall biosynthesis
VKTRVAVNLTWCVPGRVGGSEEYLVRQLLGLVGHRSEFDVQVFAPRGFSSAHPDLGELLPVHEAPTTAMRRSLRVAMENTWLARATRGFDIVHHGGGTMPTFGPRQTLLTIHDVQYTTYPEYFSRLKLAYLRRRVPASVARASVIAVPSQFVKRTLIESFGVSDERIVVVRHGMPPRLGGHATPESDLRSRFGLGSNRVVVYPAVTHPHKNHRFLVRLLAENWRDVVLVCAGSRGLAQDEVHALATELGVADRIRMTGRVSDDDRDGLLALAEAMVFPSLYEGFGAPLVEAMTIGTPVICSDQAAIPEVVGDAAMVLPLDQAAWAPALDSLSSRRAALIEAGRSRALSFSIAASGDDLASAYRSVGRAS